MYWNKLSNSSEAYRYHELFTLKDSLHAMQEARRIEGVVIVPDNFYTTCNLVNNCHNRLGLWLILEALVLVGEIIFASQGKEVWNRVTGVVSSWMSSAFCSFPKMNGELGALGNGWSSQMRDGMSSY